MLFGTATSTVPVLVFPLPSVATTVIVYTRPLPFPPRSARRLRLCGPVTTQSTGVSPSPRPLVGSLLDTEATRQVGAGSQMSVSATLSVIGTIWWFGGHSVFGEAVRALITGGVVSAAGSFERAP